MSAKIFKKFIRETLCPEISNHMNINQYQKFIKTLFKCFITTFLSVQISLKVITYENNVHVFYQNKLTAKVYIREISEIWSSAKVYFREIQKISRFSLNHESFCP